MNQYEEDKVIMISEWPVIEQEAQLPERKPITLASQKKRPHEDEAEISKSKRSNLCRFPEPLVNVSVAKWWRKQPQAVKQQYTALLPQTKNSDTLLAGIMRLEITKEFMLSEVKRLADLSKKNNEDPDLHAALGSFHEKLRNFDEAKLHLEKAILLNNAEPEYKWLLGKIMKQVKVQEEQRSATSRLPFPQSKLSMPVYQNVDRVSAENLTAERFYEEYSSKQRPVVITGLQVADPPWTWQEIRTHAGDCGVTLKHSVENSCEWARLENKEKTTVSDYIDKIEESDGKMTSDGSKSNGYLFDWSLPLHCPKLVEKLRIPRYFAGDFLQRTGEGSLYRDSWPSLFVAPAGLCSELHVDAFGSNFWMAVFKGSKRWVFFPPSDMPYLYPQFHNSMDPIFEADLTSPNLEKQPLLHLTHPTECILTEGEVLFVPAGCPHRVENMTSSVAISANFVDMSNWENVLRELELNAFVDPRSQDLLKQFTSCTFDKKMKFYDKEITWSEFKRNHLMKD
uniref:F-box protein At1g78280-like n=1 Tax=Crassostrea virginica TaxID=6565 RepID=A0A8B8CE70_CRAVI|nr:F-box protein At1g78280-like [Crassostrea virginica]